MGLRRIALLPLLVAFAPPGVLRAQCPDGTPPPCRTASPVSPAPGPARRPPPPLDARTWIVVPFENVTRAPDMDWLEDASVNLLYLDMSKWNDIKVIDDERVADLIRDVPEARSGAQLTLQSGLAVARRAGAGKLVMGDVLRVGSRTQFVGKVFDVRTGQRLRTVRQEAGNPDSLMGAFGQLARAVLNVAPPAGTSLGTIGTASVEAYQAYIAGVGALNRWMLDSAHAQFDRAIALDSTFALAHYKLALVYGWQTPNSPEGSRHAERAASLGGNLPVRERTLVRGYAAFAGNRWGEACRIFEGMVAADSNDVEAWYNLGECSYHDPVVAPLPGDTTRVSFRSSWNTALHAFRRVLELDPTYHLAFQHIQDALLATVRQGCRVPPERVTCNPQSSTYQAVIRRGGDSLLTEVANLSTPQGGEANARHTLDARQTKVRRQNLEEARRAAEAWLAAGPAGVRAHLAYARILLRLGNVRAADSVARLVTARYTSRIESTAFVTDRIEIAIKLGAWNEAVRLGDSLRAATDSVPGARNLGILIASVLGKVSGMSSMVASIQGPPWVKGYFGLAMHSTLGFPADSLLEAEELFSRNIAAGQGPARAAGASAVTLIFYDPRNRGSRWPALDTTSSDPRVQLMSVLAAGDSARSRRALALYDSMATTLRDEPDNGVALVGALGHLFVGDSAGALARLRAFRDVTIAHTSLLDPVAGGFAFAGMLWPRSFLLLGELEEAAGNRQDAGDAYRRFLGMWEKGEPAVQPMVARARAALTRIGG